MHTRMAEIGVVACVVAFAVGGRLLAQEEDAKPEGFVNQEGEAIDGVVVDGVLVDRYTGEAVEGAPVYTEDVVEGVPMPGPSVTPPEGGVSRPSGPGGSMAGRSVTAPGKSGPQPGGPSFTAGPRDPTRSRQMMLTQMKRRLGIDDQAWKIIESRLAKVLDFIRQLSAGPGSFGTLGGGPGGAVVMGPAGPGTSGAPAALGKAIAQLRTTLANPSASLDDLKKQLTVVREARERAKQELAAAQEDLRKVLTVHQEAQLVLMGQLN